MFDVKNIFAAFGYSEYRHLSGDVPMFCIHVHLQNLRQFRCDSTFTTLYMHMSRQDCAYKTIDLI